MGEEGKVRVGEGDKELRKRWRKKAEGEGRRLAIKVVI